MFSELNVAFSSLFSEPAGKGRMRFTVKRYDSVPTSESQGGGGDGSDGGLGEYQAPPGSVPSSSDNNTNPPSSPEPHTPPSPRAPPVTVPRLQEKQPYSDLDFMDSPSMDSFTSTLFDRGEATERDAVALRGRYSISSHTLGYAHIERMRKRK